MEVWCWGSLPVPPKQASPEASFVYQRSLLARDVDKALLCLRRQAAGLAARRDPRLDRMSGPAHQSAELERLRHAAAVNEPVDVARRTAEHFRDGLNVE